MPRKYHTILSTIGIPPNAIGPRELGTLKIIATFWVEGIACTCARHSLLGIRVDAQLGLATSIEKEEGKHREWVRQRSGKVLGEEVHEATT
jgi:hypothetical protein